MCRRPWWVLGVALAVTAASVVTTCFQLTFQSDRNALLSPDLEWNRYFEDWRASFPGDQDFYVVIDSGPPEAPDRDERLVEAKALADQLGPALQANSHVDLAVSGFDRSQFSPRTIRLLDMSEFQTRLAQIAQSQPLLQADTPQRFLAGVMASLQQQKQDVSEAQAAQAIEALTGFIHAIRQTLASPPDDRPNFGDLAMPTEEAVGREYLVSPNGRLLFIRVTPRFENGSINALRPAITAIREVVTKYAAQYPQIEAGLTGIDVVEADETDAATRDSTIASIIAAALITVLLLSAFHSWRTPLLVMLALTAGITWSFGFLTLTVGHLQVISVIFAVILLGLGVAFGIHILSCMELVRHRYADDAAGFEAAMVETIQTVGPGVITGAVTTSVAFCMTLLTDFKGVAEMGLIAAAGIMLCLLAMFTVLPALLRVFAPHHRCYTPLADRYFHLFDPAWVMPFVRRPYATLAVSGVLTAACLAATTGMRFDYDLTNLYPRGVDSVQWQQRITQDGGQSIWTAVSVVDSLESARRRKARFLELGVVDRVNGIGLLFPEDEQQKLEAIKAVRNKLGDALTGTLNDRPATPDPPSIDLGSQLSAMLLAMQAAASRDMPQEIRQEFDRLQQALLQAISVQQGLAPDQRTARLAVLQDEYQRWRYNTATQIDQALDTAPLEPSDLPSELVWPYEAKAGPYEGGYALEVQPKLPEDARLSGPLDPRFLPKFVHRLKEIDSKVTGVIVQVFHSGHLILKSYRLAGVYALVAVLLLVWVDFWSLRAAVLSLVPVAVGFAVTFGVMRLLGMRINPANIIVLPLMFGIGVDCGVHMLHRYVQAPGDDPPGLTKGTGKAITITSLTTMIGFGAMMLARHRGIASLGFVMTTGIGLTMLACWAVVPAWLVVRRATSKNTLNQ